MDSNSNQHSDTILELGQNRGALHEKAKVVCKDLLEGWADVRLDDIKVHEISGGITNILLKLSPSPETSLQPVMLRVFGDNTDLVIDREKEKRLLPKLNSAGFGALVLGVFGNGRLEQYLPMRNLEPEELQHPRLSALIAARLRQFHAVETGERKVANLFDTIRGWLKMAEGLQFDDPVKQAKVAKFDFGALLREVEETQALCLALEPPLVTSHNDLLAGNVLIPLQETPDNVTELQFIDFEYSCYSYRGYDLGNHFNEYAGFECDFSRYPSLAQASAFVTAYLAEGASTSPTAEEVRRVTAEANLFALVSHQYWGVWAVIQAKYSPIDFNYAGYSHLRWDEYYQRKAEFFSGAKAVLES